MKYNLLVLVLLCSLVSATFGKEADDEQDDQDEQEVQVDPSDSTDNVTESVSGVVDANVEMTGVANINGAIWIDGVKINKPQSLYVSKKNGKTYRIHWDKDGNGSVTTEK